MGVVDEFVSQAVCWKLEQLGYATDNPGTLVPLKRLWESIGKAEQWNKDRKLVAVKQFVQQSDNCKSAKTAAVADIPALLENLNYAKQIVEEYNQAQSTLVGNLNFSSSTLLIT